MINNNEKLKQLLEIACVSKLSETQATELVKISRIIISAYLRNHKYYFLETLNRYGLNYVDVAIDVIAEAFSRDSENKYFYLISFANSLKSPITQIEPNELFLAYYCFLCKIADAHITRTFAQVDPAGYKILRNIKETISGMPNFTIRKTDSGVYVFLTDSNEKDHGCPDYELLEYEFLSKSITKRTTRELLEVLNTVLSNHGAKSYEIKLTDILRLFKTHYGNGEKLFSERAAETIAISEINSFEIKQVCSVILSKIKQKIYIDYFSNGKLTQQQAVVLSATIGDIVSDWLDYGENSLSFFEYFNRNMNITKTDYDTYIKSKIEYLIKTIRKELTEYFYIKKQSSGI